MLLAILGHRGEDRFFNATVGVESQRLQGGGTSGGFGGGVLGVALSFILPPLDDLGGCHGSGTLSDGLEKDIDDCECPDDNQRCLKRVQVGHAKIIGQLAVVLGVARGGVG